jgi:hypothetical protein
MLAALEVTSVTIWMLVTSGFTLWKLLCHAVLPGGFGILDQHLLPC